MQFEAEVKSGVSASGAFSEEERIGNRGAGSSLFPGGQHFLDSAEIAKTAARHAS